MRRRTRAREFALQILYQMDITGDSYIEALSNFWQAYDQENIESEIKDFADQIVKGVAENLSRLDAEISQYATNWQLSRMAVVDRNILRISSYELVFRNDVPWKVSINEAVELAKKYSGNEAGKFVNAILDKIKQETHRDEVR